MKYFQKYSLSQPIKSWKKTTFIVLILSIIIGCNSKDGSPSSPSDESFKVFDLLPVVVGKYWCVEGSLNGVVKGYETREIIKDTVVHGRQGFEVNFTWDNINPDEWSAEHKWYYSNGDSNIFRMRSNWDSWQEFFEFKDFPNASVGDTIHIEEYIDAEYMERRVYTVCDKNASKTVKAGSFDSCYVVKYDVKFTFAGDLIRHEFYLDYYAPGVGFIWEKDSCYYSNGESEIWIWDLLYYNIIL